MTMKPLIDAGVAVSLVYIEALIIIFLLMSHGFYLVDAKIRKKR